MVNKVRKKNGDMKYPYDVVMPFAQAIEFVKELQNLSVVKYCHNDNKSYGTYIWGTTYDNKDFTELIAVCKKFIPDFEMGKTNGIYNAKYHGDYIGIGIYVAYSEFDKEV